MSLSGAPDLSALFGKIAPAYNYSLLLNHLRHQFRHLGDVAFGYRLAECLKFLYLRSRSGRGFIPLASEVDEFWHEIILQTREYARLCACLPSGQFIHHNSVSISEETQHLGQAAVVENLLRWIPQYVAEFGPFTEETAHYWMIIQLLQKEFAYTLEELNTIQ